MKLMLAMRMPKPKEPKRAPKARLFRRFMGEGFEGQPTAFVDEPGGQLYHYQSVTRGILHSDSMAGLAREIAKLRAELKAEGVDIHIEMPVKHYETDGDGMGELFTPLRREDREAFLVEYRALIN